MLYILNTSTGKLTETAIKSGDKKCLKCGALKYNEAHKQFECILGMEDECLEVTAETEIY